MADPLFIVRDPSSGAVVFDSRDAYAGICVGIIDIASGATATYTYPDYAGCTAIVLSALGSNAWGYTVDTTLGYPRLSVSAGSARTFLVFMQ